MTRKPCCLTPQPGFTLASSGPNRQLPGEESEGVVGPVGNRNGHAGPVESHGKGATAPSTEVAPNQPPQDHAGAQWLQDVLLTASCFPSEGTWRAWQNLPLRIEARRQTMLLQGLEFSKLKT